MKIVKRSVLKIEYKDLMVRIDNEHNNASVIAAVIAADTVINTVEARINVRITENNGSYKAV